MRWIQRLSRSGSRPRAAVVLAAVAAVTGACDELSVEWDEQAKKEILACGHDPIGDPVAPPPGTYQDQGIALDWDKLAPLPDPTQGASVFYIKDTYESAARMEQVYYDATHGNPRAAWLICMEEATLRWTGREAAKELASLKCQTIMACSYRWDWLPWSRQTASGARMLGEIGGEFAAEATRRQIGQQLIADALTLGMGAGSRRGRRRWRRPGASRRRQRRRRGGRRARHPRVRRRRRRRPSRHRRRSPGRATSAPTARRERWGRTSCLPSLVARTRSR